MDKKVIYLNYGEVKLDKAIVAFRGKDQWIVIGKDWWTMADYSFSDMLEVTCPVHDIPDLNVLGTVQVVTKTPDEVLSVFMMAVPEVV